MSSISQHMAIRDQEEALVVEIEEHRKRVPWSRGGGR